MLFLENHFCASTLFSSIELMMFAHVSACNLDNLPLTNPWKFHRLFFILIWFPIPCIHFMDFKIKPETEMIWIYLMKIWLLATNWLEMKWTMVVLSIVPQWHSSYFFNVFSLRKCNLTCKVKVLWGGHIIWKNDTLGFDVYSLNVKIKWDISSF